jgi:hypothetical protein
MAELGINYLAVLVAAVATYALGMLWYSPALFGKAWQTAMGLTPEQTAAMQRGAGRAYVVTFVCWLVMALAVAILVRRTGLHVLLGGVKIGVVCWGGFALPIGLSGLMFSGKRPAGFLIETGYQLVSLLGMGIILALWQ